MNKVSKALQQAQRDRALAPAPRPPAPRLQRAVSAPPGIDPHLVSLLEPVSFAAEQYRTLRHIVEQMHRADTLSVLAVSAPSIGDGKTTTAINLAGALAQAPGVRVLLVDADLRRPAVGGRLALAHNARGLVNAVLDPSLTLGDVVQARPAFNLSVLPAGPPTVSPYEILRSPRLGQLFTEARQEYDYVVVDTPPLIPVPDCRIIGGYVDGFLLVVTAHKTRPKLFDEAMRILDASKVLGIVFNGSDVAETADYYAGYSVAGPPDGVAAVIRPWYPGRPHFERLRRRWTQR